MRRPRTPSTIARARGSARRVRVRADMGCSASKSPSAVAVDGAALPVAAPQRLKRSTRDPMVDYEDVGALGAGGFSVVRRVRDRKTMKPYAMKIIGVNDGSEKSAAKGKDEKERMSMEEVTSEIDILRLLKSPNVLRLQEVIWYNHKVYVVTEVLDGGAVLDAILRMKDERYTEKEAKVVVQRTLQAVDYMHKNFVLHRDLKLENLLLRSNDMLDSVVIADFGLARRCENATGAACLPHAQGVDTSPVGTPVYAAPEVVEQHSYGAAIDIWSVGVIAYVLLTGAMPRNLWKGALKYHRVTERDFGFDCYEWDSVSEEGREFVMACLAYKPTHRLSAANCLRHPWLQKVDVVRPAPLRIKSKLRDFAKGMKLPLKRYAAGEVLIRQGARASDEVFLIKSGTVKIVVSPQDKEGNIDRSRGKQVARREPGEFIGEMALGDHLIAKTLSRGKAGSTSDLKRIIAKGPPKRRPGDQVSLAGWAAARTYAKLWIGGRRNADVIAETNVECLVMGSREMAWAIASDPEVATELQRNMQQRRFEISESRKE